MQANNMMDALNMYNKAVVFAPNVDDNLGKACAERAHVLLILGDYKWWFLKEKLTIFIKGHVISFLKGRKVTLPWFYRSTFWYPDTLIELAKEEWNNKGIKNKATIYSSFDILVANLL